MRSPRESRKWIEREGGERNAIGQKEVDKIKDRRVEMWRKRPHTSKIFSYRVKMNVFVLFCFEYSSLLAGEGTICSNNTPQ